LRHQFGLSFSQLDSQRLKVEITIATLGEHFILFFFDVMIDIFTDHGQFSIKQPIY
jgi:hypothetical protein